ncbi:MAG: CinA family protein [Pyramidobacter sp.]|jgi:PncC family amidohydrolase
MASRGEIDREIELLARELKELALAAGVTVGTAESCTGGLIAGAITAVPGSSGFFYGGIVSYHNSVKTNLLKVPAEVLKTDGAVSAPCARAMAEGAARRLGVDLAVAVTGIAGPDGGSAEKPVGTVWFGLYDRGGTACELKNFSGDRGEVRAQTVRHALELLCAPLRG